MKGCLNRLLKTWSLASRNNALSKWSTASFRQWNENTVLKTRNIFESNSRCANVLFRFFHFGDFGRVAAVSLASSFIVHAATKETRKNVGNIDLKTFDPKNLSYSFLISQAIAQTVDAVTNLLTQTTLAILDADETYRKELTALLDLLEENFNTLTKSYEDEKVWDSVVALRSESESKKRKLNDLEVYLQSVVKLMNEVAEVAFRSDCDFASVTASQRVQATLDAIEQSKEKTQKVEADYLKLYGKVITETGKKKREVRITLDGEPVDALL